MGPAVSLLLGGTALLAFGVTPPRPRVLGISHVAFRVSDLEHARTFYSGLLGLAATARKKGASTRLLCAVSERQHLELVAGARGDEDRLDHVALETDDVEAMRRHLAARGVDVPARVTRDPDGHRFTVRDPDGHAVEFVQAGRGWPRTSSPGPPTGLSGRILHAGILVGDLAAAQAFYAEILGFSETWRGSRTGTELSWTNMKVADGEDYLEFMLYADLPPPHARGSPHHACLEVPDVEAAKAQLLGRSPAANYTRPLEVRVGTNRRRQLNLFDPDGTRIELMEPQTVDGQPVPSSTAPPPRRR